MIDTPGKIKHVLRTVVIEQLVDLRDTYAVCAEFVFEFHFATNLEQIQLFAKDIRSLILQGITFNISQENSFLGLFVLLVVFL